MSDQNHQSDQDSLLGSEEAPLEQEQKIEEPELKPRKFKKIKKNRKKERSSFKLDKKEAKERELKKEARQYAENIIQKMNQAYNEDLELMNKGKIVNKKILYSTQLEKQLRDKYISEEFLDIGGLSSFETWLRKAPNGADPNITIKKRLFNILLALNIRESHIQDAGELQSIIKKNRKSPTKQIKETAEAIINKWRRMCYDMMV